MNNPKSEIRNPKSAGNLARLGRLTLKELREILRDRRTIITLVLMPLLLYPLLSIAFQQFFLSSLGKVQTPTYILGFRNAEEERYVARFLSRGRDRLEAAPPESSADVPLPPPELVERTNPMGDLEQQVRDFAVDVGIRFVEGKPRNLDPRGDIAADLELLYNTGSYTSRDAVAYIEKCLTAANEVYLARRLGTLGVTQRPVPVQAIRKPLADPQARGGTLSIAAIVPFVLILMTIAGAVYPAIDLTAGERERGTLEVLVAAPIPRIGLLFAKYVAVVTVALLTAMANLATMTVTIFVGGLGRLLFGDAGLSVGVIAAVFGLLLLFAAFFSAVLLVLTSFARSFKEAQAYLIPLMLVSLAPGMLSLTPGLELSGLLLVTPLVNIVLLGRDLFELRATAAAAATVVVSTVLYAAAAIALAARIFGAESVLYSSQSSWADLFRRPREPQPAPTLTSAMFCLALLFPAYFLLNGVLAQWSGASIGVRLVLAGTVTALLFGGFPIAAAWMARVPLATACALRPARWTAWPAAVLLGLSLWMVAHETVVLIHAAGLVTLNEKHFEKARTLLEQLRALPPALIVISLGVVPAVFEELFFRGYLFRALRERITLPATIWGSALLFGLFHLIVTDGLAFERFVPSTLLGAILAWICWRTGSVFPGMLLHACHNGFLLIVSYYEPQLKSWGWGLVEEQHLPAMWLACGAVMAAAGILLVQFQSRVAPTPAGSPGR